MDNCSRRNKNWYIFDHLECPVAWSVFDDIIVSFIPAGHLQKNIFQAFSCTSNARRHRDALHEVISKVYNDQTTVSHIFQMVAVSDHVGWRLFAAFVKCIHDSQIFHVWGWNWNFFEIDKPTSTWKQGSFCSFRKDAVIEFSHLFVRRDQDGHGLFKFSLTSKSSHQTGAGCFIEKNRFTKRIISKKSRENDSFKMKDLFELWNKIYTDTIMGCHENF